MRVHAMLAAGRASGMDKDAELPLLIHADSIILDAMTTELC